MDTYTTSFCLPRSAFDWLRQEKDLKQKQQPQQQREKEQQQQHEHQHHHHHHQQGQGQARQSYPFQHPSSDPPGSGGYHIGGDARNVRPSRASSSAGQYGPTQPYEYNDIISNGTDGGREAGTIGGVGGKSTISNGEDRRNSRQTSGQSTSSTTTTTSSSAGLDGGGIGGHSFSSLSHFPSQSSFSSLLEQPSAHNTKGNLVQTSNNVVPNTSSAIAPKTTMLTNSATTGTTVSTTTTTSSSSSSSLHNRASTGSLYGHTKNSSSGGGSRFSRRSSSILHQGQVQLPPPFSLDNHNEPMENDFINTSQSKLSSDQIQMQRSAAKNDGRLESEGQDGKAHKYHQIDSVKRVDEGMTDTEATRSTFQNSLQAQLAEAAMTEENQQLEAAVQTLCSQVMNLSKCFISFTVIDLKKVEDGGIVGGRGRGGDSYIFNPPKSSSASTFQDWRTYESEVGDHKDEKIPRTVGSGKIYNFHVSGGYQQVMSARGLLLRENPFKRTSIVRVPKSELVDTQLTLPYTTQSNSHNGRLKSEIVKKLDEIAHSNKVHLAIVGQLTSSFSSSAGLTASSPTSISYPSVSALNIIAQTPSSSRSIRSGKDKENLLSGGPTNGLNSSKSSTSKNNVKIDSNSNSSNNDGSLNNTINNKETIKENTGKGNDAHTTSISYGSVMLSATQRSNFGFETEQHVEIIISGGYEQVEQARVRVLVLLDELSGLHSEVCEIDYKLHNIISGRKRCVAQTVQEETGTNIYFPTPLSGVLGSGGTHASAGPGAGNGPETSAQGSGTGQPSAYSSLLSKQNLIFITGEFFGVQRAREMLFQVSMHKSKCIISRDTAILPRKLDWMLTDRLEKLKQIMNDNGTFIKFPSIGSQASLISVYGDHRVNIERTIRAVMQLACQFYVASLWLLPIAFDAFMPPVTFNPSQIPPILRRIAVQTGAEAVFKGNCFELHGLESEVRAAVQLVLLLDFVKAFHHEIRFQIELANEHRAFISGKKNGKLNKIMKSANVKIKFETFNDYNFLIDVAGSNTGALHGLTMLQEELPAEISFHVPEVYHKRIIGVGGKNIQRIMKKFGVYVKFSNAEEFIALGGYNDNEDNVIARTPAKNSGHLDQLKQSVMELVSPKDKDFVIETVYIPRRYHRTLLGEKNIFIHDIEAKTNSAVRFPNKETGSNSVTIFGPESQIHIAAQMLLDHVPFEAEYRVPHSAELAALTLSPDFISLTDRIKQDYNISILPWVDRSGAGAETIIRFSLNGSNVDGLANAKDVVEEYLSSRQVELYPSSLNSLKSKSEALPDAFPLFNSKLLSNMAPDSERREDGLDRRVRMAASSPNIKALFDGDSVSPYPRHGIDQVSGSQHQQRSLPSRKYSHQQHSSFPFQSSQRPELASSSLPLPSEYDWEHPQSALGNVLSGSTVSSPVSAPTHAHRMSYDQSYISRLDQTRRDSPFDENLEDKLRDMPTTRKPLTGRYVANRTQSLDLSHQMPRRYLQHNSATHHESVDEASNILTQLGL